MTERSDDQVCGVAQSGDAARRTRASAATTYVIGGAYPRYRAPGAPVQKNLRAPASVKERAQQRDKPSLGFARTSPNEDECKNQLPLASTLSLSTTIKGGCCPSACDDRGRSLSASLTVLLRARVLRSVLSVTRFHRLDSAPPTLFLLNYGAVKDRVSESVKLRRRR